MRCRTIGISIQYRTNDESAATINSFRHKKLHAIYLTSFTLWFHLFLQRTVFFQSRLLLCIIFATRVLPCELHIICLMILYRRSSTLWKETKIFHIFLTTLNVLICRLLIIENKQANNRFKCRFKGIQWKKMNWSILKTPANIVKMESFYLCVRHMTFFLSVMRRWPWRFMAGCDLFWLGVGECGWVWLFLAECGSVWVSVGECTVFNCPKTSSF